MCFYSPYQSPHVRNSKNLLDSEFRYWIPDSLAVKLGFQIPILSRIPDCLSCNSNSKDLDFGFHKKNLLDSGLHVEQKFPGFRNPNAFTGRSPTILHILNWSNQLYIPLIANLLSYKTAKKKKTKKNKNKKGKLELISHANNHA